MVELWIDDKRCDVDKIPSIPIDFSVEKLLAVEGGRVGRKVVLELPTTPRNDLLFGSSRDIYAASRFNMEHHTAKIKVDDVVVFGGTVHLLATAIGGDEGYRIRICEGGAEWIESVVQGGLSDLDIPFSTLYTLPAISGTWEGDCAVRFLPVWRGGKSYGFSASTLPVEHIMLTDDYHPFISIAAMVKAMFANLGYTLRSNFFESDLGRSLYMSGDYLRGDVASAKSKCDFFARRSAPVSATADAMGRVYATTSVATHTVGTIVDTVNPEEYDSDGVQMIECFNTFNALSRSDNGDLCFTPKSSVKVGFLLHLEYTTDYRVISRDKFAGFNIVNGVNGVKVEFPLANTIKDYRNDLSASWQYRAVVFDHVANRVYRLLATTENGEASYSMGEWSSRSALVATSSAEPSSAQLYYRDSSSASWSVYQGDWALYAGYFEEEGVVDVVMDIRFPPQDVAAGDRLLLDKFWFGGADKGMKITIGNGTTLRPYFTAVPGYGSTLSFEDIAPRNIRQSDLLEAVGEMFNLAFYTDRERKEVHIEPLESLYEDAEVIDIRHIVDYAYGIEIADSGIDAPQTHLFAYKAGDKASEKFNAENGTILGEWSYRNPLYGTIDAECVVGNKLFTTTLNITNVVGCAPSASLMQVGDKGEQEEGMDNGFMPHIVCYKGMRSLPEGESWIVGENLCSYPYAAFVDEEVNLGYGEHNGVEGLRAYHIPALSRQTQGQRITLDIVPTIAETASILTESGPKPSVRKLFRFEIEGESSLYRIVKIDSWNTENGVVRCTFERILKD